ncbi:MAG: BREX system P-loop protein BrxC [Hyphomicrobiales bacterium]|nr:BREX system P-loop protein BrxC [Hyphomicrobiales bacterium]
MTSPIKSLFANDISRPIEEVIKVDQTDEQVIKFEIDEYVTTDAIARHYADILDSFAETPNKPHEGVGVWVSGFFGSGKSSFAKMLGLALENRPIEGTPAAERFGQRTNDKIRVLLTKIAETIPTHAVIFDVSTDRGIRSGNQTLTEIMYRLFLASLGYPTDLDLAELEIGLEEDGRLDDFVDVFRTVTNGKEWEDRKKSVAFALGEASAAMHSLEPEIYADQDSWSDAHKGKADISPGLLAKRVNELMARRKPDHTVVFVVDEVGQFVARDVQKMLDLQAIVQQFGVHGRGKQWLIVTSQEKLNEMVGGLDDKRIELARLMDRFPQKPHLEPSDIAEVTGKRVLTKNADAQKALGALYEDHRGQLTAQTKLSADITLPELSRDGFVDLYPLLPYQIDLIIQVVSGLRTQGGASKHVGGANRTIIKLAQQLLIHPDVALGDGETGQLARLDQIYDLVESNIAGEVRAKIHKIPEQVEHPEAQAVAKAICLLQFVQSVHRTAENIAAALHPVVDAPSHLPVVKEALAALEAAQLVRQGDDGYRIPTPAEDDWERQRNGTSPRPADTKRLHREVVTGFWKPQPTHNLEGVKSFKAGLMIDGREEEKGDLGFHLTFAEDAEYSDVVEEMRTRSQQEDGTVFWVVPLSEQIDRATVELYRSKEILSRKARDARTADETALVSEERTRERRHSAELQRLLKAAVLGGTAYFRGNDRSPTQSANDVGKAAADILAQVLPDVFTRFSEGAAKANDAKRGLDELLKAENLEGLPSVFTALGLLRDQDGKTVIDVDAPALREVLGRIEHDSDYGTKATGKSLADHFGRDPFGWDFEVTRLLVAALLAADKIQLKAGSTDIDSRHGVAARDALTNNNSFRSASCSPKKGVDFADVAKAAERFKETFGTEVRELSQGGVVTDLRSHLADHEDELQGALGLLTSQRLPGGEVLDEALARVKAIIRGTEEAAIAEFNSSFQTVKDGIKRAGELNQTLTPTVTSELEAARRVLLTQWPFLDAEPDLDPQLRTTAESLGDLLARETFFRELNDIEVGRTAIEEEHDRRFGQELADKVAEYMSALETLIATPGWADLSDEIKSEIAGPLQRHSDTESSSNDSIPQLRSDRDACLSRLQQAVKQVHHAVEGDRVVSVDVGPFFQGGVEDTEQLEAALDGLRGECERLIADGKKIIVG